MRKPNISWLEVAEIIYIVVLIYILVGRNSAPVMMRFWRSLMIACHNIAWAMGQASIYAEKAYWQAVERARP